MTTGSSAPCRAAVSDLVNASAGAMNAGVLVTFARVAPVEHEDAAVGAVTDFHSAEPRILGNEEVGAMFSTVAAAVAFQDFLIGTTALQIPLKKSRPIA